MAVVTISRLIGIGGRQFGLQLAKRLGYDYLDKELLSILSKKLGSREEQIALYEKSGDGPSPALLAMLGRKYPAAMADFPDSAEYVNAMSEIIRELAERDRVVIVGRGGQAVLADLPEALHLRLVADERSLLSRLAEKPEFYDASESDILKRYRRMSGSSVEFVRRHFGIDVADPLHYHLVINLSRLAAAEAVEMVYGHVKRIEKKTAKKK